MNGKWKRKWLISVALIVSMVFSVIGTAAATEPFDSTMTVDTKSETKPDSGKITIQDSGDMTDPDSGDGTDQDSGDATDQDSEDATDQDSEDGTNQDSEDGTNQDSGDGTDQDSEDGTNQDSEDATDQDSEDGTNQDSEDGTNQDSEDESESESKDEIQSDPENGTDSVPGNEEDSNSGDEDGSDSEDSVESETGQETESKTEDKTTEENSPENPDEESADPENPDNLLSVDLTPDLSDHSWSMEWNYDETWHWHECDEEDCPLTENSEKEGYGEHSYGIDNACTVCGYVEPVNPLARTGVIPTYEEAYEAMIALKDKYPEGMEWTNFTPYGSKGSLGDSYVWKGGRIYGSNQGVGCSAFAFILSDAAFDHLPARAFANGQFTFDDVKVGDILRVNNNSHSVIVLKKSAGGVIVAEANYNKSVHWGRALSKSEVSNASHWITRYPDGYEEDDSQDEVLDQDGTVGSLSWTLTSKGVLTISGDGAIPDYPDSNSSPWYPCKSDINTVILEDGVTEIGDYAFYESGVLSIHIPDSVERIGANAFERAELLSVTIPGSVGEIGNSAFNNCANLTSVTVSEGVETIGNEAFRGCTSLAYIDFPASITSVGSGAFMSCLNMTRVRFMPGNRMVTLGDNLFSECQHLTSVTLPQTTDRISSGMFASCTSLPTLYIPASVTEIGENPFTSCIFLKYIYFGGSQAEWNGISNPYLEASLKSTGTTVVFNVPFEDPFAPDPNDPGDLLPDTGGDETDPDNGNTGHKHSWSETWSQDGTAHWHECSAGCPITDNRNKNGYGSHLYGGWIIDVNATASQSGSRHRDCRVCGYRQTMIIPVTGSSGSSSDSSGSSHESDNTASTTVEQFPDGSHVATTIQKDGTVTKITTDAEGRSVTEVNLSRSAISSARQRGDAVTLPVSPVSAVQDAAEAPAIIVHTGNGAVKAAIPAVSPGPGTVAVIIHEDGSAKVIESSALTNNSVVAVLPDGATVKILDNSKHFPDVPAGSRFENAVTFVSARDLFYGTAATAFAPDAPMTYATLITALTRLNGAETEGGTTWYARSMEWATAQGINNGSNPDSNIDCEELITTLWLYTGSPVTVNAPSESRDINQISPAQAAMNWAVKNGILNGFEQGISELPGQLSRGQTAQIIMNFVNHPYFPAISSVQN